MSNSENGNWIAEKEDLKKRFALLTNNDMPEDSQNQELWAKLQIMLGTITEESNSYLSDL